MQTLQVENTDELPPPLGGYLTCKKCKRKKPVADFIWQSGADQGIRGRCQECKKNKQKHGPLWLPTPRYEIRPHAVWRYQERVNNTTFNKARIEMIQKMEEAIWQQEKPWWCYQELTQENIDLAENHPFNRGYLIVDKNTAFCLSGYRQDQGPEKIKVSTVLVRKDNS